MFNSGKYPETLFFTHLAIEKLLKSAVVANTKKYAPPIHDLERLLRFSGLDIEQKMLTDLGTYNKFYMAGQYDEQKMNFRKKCTKKFTTPHYYKMKEYFLWLKKEIKNKYQTK